MRNGACEYPWTRRSQALVLVISRWILATTPVRARDNPIAAGPHRFSVGRVQLWYRVAGRSSGVVFLHGGPGEGSQTFAHYAGGTLEARLRVLDSVSQVFDFIGGKGGTRTLDPGIMRTIPCKKAH
jgi:hypothetical protein